MSVQLISAKEISMYMDDGVLLVDMREREEYEAFHFPGAVSLPYEEDYAAWRARLPGRRAYILYCDRGNTSLYAAKHLSDEGRIVYDVAGGVEAWLRKKKTIDSKTTKR